MNCIKHTGQAIGFALLCILSIPIYAILPIILSSIDFWKCAKKYIRRTK